MQHPISRAMLERFAAGKAAPEENRAIVSHLLKGCESCSRVLREFEQGPEPAEIPVDAYDAYDRALSRFEREIRVAVEARSGMFTALRTVLVKSGKRLVSLDEDVAFARS